MSGTRKAAYHSCPVEIVLKVKKYKKTSRVTSALDTSVVLESVLILNY